jgi:thimet oligopeptidase
VQENVNRVEVQDAAELDGLPEDYIRNHPPNEQGVITLTTDYPDMQPVMTFAGSADCACACSAPTTPALTR